MKLTFTLLPDDYAIICLAHDAPVPDWIGVNGLVSVTRADDELSIVCRTSHVPPAVVAETGWVALRVDMLAALDEPGVILAAITPVSSAGLGVFVISTHLRDYILVRKNEFARAKQALIRHGHEVG